MNLTLLLGKNLREERKRPSNKSAVYNIDPLNNEGQIKRDKNRLLTNADGLFCVLSLRVRDLSS